jgi:hypothetical protein
MCFIEGYLKYIDNKIRAEYMPNHLYKNMDLVYRLDLYNFNMEIFQRKSLNEIAIPKGQQGAKDS